MHLHLRRRCRLPRHELSGSAMRLTTTIARCVAVFIGAMPSPVPAQTSAQTATALIDGRGECVRFRWDPDSVRKAGLSIPITLNGREMWFQLDTGTNTDIIYGSIAVDAGWTSKDAKSFRATELKVGSTRLNNAPVAVYRNQPVEETAGEIGLADLVGRVAVIDYPAQRFCLFAPGGAPKALLAQAHWAEGALRNGKFFVPMSVGTSPEKEVIFDTGSSEFPLWVDLPLWRQITGLEDLSTAKQEVRGNHFSTPVIFKGAPTIVPLKIGPISIGSRIAYTKIGDPNMFASWPYVAAGIIGNEPFWEGTILIDLSDSRTRLGVVASRP